LLASYLKPFAPYDKLLKAFKYGAVLDAGPLVCPHLGLCGK